MSFELILGGLFATAVFLYPALQLKRRRKWNIFMGILMLIAGIGTIGIAAWLASVAASLTSALFVGAIALILLAGFGIGVVCDLVPDWKVDHPWRVFALPPLFAIVITTGTAAFSYAAQQYGENFEMLTSQVTR